MTDKVDVDAKEILGRSGSVNTKHQGPTRRPVEAIVIDKGATGGNRKKEETPMANEGFLRQGRSEDGE